MKTADAITEPIPQTRPDKIPPAARKIIAVAILGPFMAQMDSTIVNVSLSSIQRDLHSTISLAHWIISGYLLALALMLPLNAWLVDRLGAKKLYLVCFSLFTAASALCGMAATMPELIGARIIQGIAGGLLAPLAQLMMARVAGKQMARVFGFAALPVLLAPLAGPTLAGAILKYLGWPWLFYVNVPVGIVAAILAAYIIPRDIVETRRHRFDLPGFLMLSPALVGLLLGLDRVSHHKGPWVLVFGLLLFSVFIWHAKRKKTKALMDLEFFKIRTFSTATTTQFLANGTMYAGQFLIPLFLVTGCHLTATQAGWILGAMGIGMLCAYPSMGYLTDRFGCRPVACSGIFLNFLGTLPFLWMAFNGFSMTLAIFGLLVRGLGQGATGIPSMAAAYSAVPKGKLSLATMTVNIVQRVGGPTITTIIALATSMSFNLTPASGRSFLVPFGALMAIQLLLLGAASRLPLRIHKEAGSRAESV